MPSPAVDDTDAFRLPVGDTRLGWSLVVRQLGLNTVTRDSDSSRDVCRGDSAHVTRQHATRVQVCYPTNVVGCKSQRSQARHARGCVGAGCYVGGLAQVCSLCGRDVIVLWMCRSGVAVWVVARSLCGCVAVVPRCGLPTFGGSLSATVPRKASAPQDNAQGLPASGEPFRAVSFGDAPSRRGGVPAARDGVQRRSGCGGDGV